MWSTGLYVHDTATDAHMVMAVLVVLWRTAAGTGCMEGLIAMTEYISKVCRLDVRSWAHWAINWKWLWNH